MNHDKLTGNKNHGSKNIMLRYVVPDTPGKQHSLLAGLDVNPLEGWDPAKVNHSDADGKV